jgi:16S rRNA (guanine1207-N2)-methyltransferase
MNILDMGCGCGLVGFLVASSLSGSRQAPGTNAAAPHESNIRLVMVDSHTRAVEAANLNAEKLGIPAEVILSDNGTPAQMDGSFDVFVGNPPYYSDYRIADIFLETARRALKYGGVCYTVCKNADGLEPVQRRYFPEVEIIRRRGYAVLKSVKN